MTLADAIRKGAMQRPQTKYHPFTMNSVTGELGSCALGAAYEGLLGETERDNVMVYLALKAHFGLYAKDVACPACGEARIDLDTIAHLNDSHRWTREAIADWLDTLPA